MFSNISLWFSNVFFIYLSLLGYKPVVLNFICSLDSSKGNGIPLQYFCLENPMDGGDWVGCSPWGLKESDMTERLHFRFSLSCIGEGNSNPLQCSCLESPRDGGAWWAAVYGVTQSRTRLKWVSSLAAGCSKKEAWAPPPRGSAGRLCANWSGVAPNHWSL